MPARPRALSRLPPLRSHAAEDERLPRARGPRTQPAAPLRPVEVRRAQPRLRRHRRPVRRPLDEVPRAALRRGRGSRRRSRPRVTAADERAADRPRPLGRKASARGRRRHRHARRQSPRDCVDVPGRGPPLFRRKAPHDECRRGSTTRRRRRPREARLRRVQAAAHGRRRPPDGWHPLRGPLRPSAGSRGDGRHRGARRLPRPRSRRLSVDRLVLVAIGGGIGSVLRYLTSGVAARWLGLDFPYGTLIVNVAGSFLIGLVQALAEDATVLPEPARVFLSVGVMGGFTTYSAFSYETVRLVELDAFGPALANVVVTTVPCLGACVLGMAAGRALLALRG